jgi:hypothetical protein
LHPDVEDAIFEVRRNVLGISIIGQGETADKRPVGAFDPVEAFALLFFLGLPFAVLA